MATLTFWAERFPDRKPEHYVFPTEKYGLDGEAGYLNGQVVPYEVNPAKPMGSWKTAWKAARKMAGRTLSGKPERQRKPSRWRCRTHDLRHTAISRMIERRSAASEDCQDRGMVVQHDGQDGCAVRSLQHWMNCAEQSKQSAVRKRILRWGPRYFPRYRRRKRRVKNLS